MNVPHCCHGAAGEHIDINLPGGNSSENEDDPDPNMELVRASQVQLPPLPGNLMMEDVWKVSFHSWLDVKFTLTPSIYPGIQGEPAAELGPYQEGG